MSNKHYKSLSQLPCYTRDTLYRPVGEYGIIMPVKVYPGTVVPVTACARDLCCPYPNLYAGFDKPTCAGSCGAGVFPRRRRPIRRPRFRPVVKPVPLPSST